MNDLTETEKIRLNEIMSQFDFEKVHRCMILMNWRWVTDTGFEVPDLKTIKHSAKGLIITVILSYLRQKISGYSGSGGFQVSYNHYHDYIEMQFILTEWMDDYIVDEEVYKSALQREKRKKTIKKLLDGTGE